MASLASHEGQKRGAAAISLVYNIVVTIAKIVAASLTGSVSLLSESVHSATDIIASIVAYMSVRAAALPPDEDHPYGHGKIETLAGFGESILLLEIVVYILFEAGRRLIEHTAVQNVGVGALVMGGSAVGSLLVGRYIQRIGRDSDSMALQSNGQHLMVDFWTSVGVLAALLVTHLTGWVWCDAAFALVLAYGIFRSAWRMACLAYQQLIDRTLPEEELQLARAVLNSEPGVLSHHRLRARHSGNFHYIEVHVVVPNDWSVIQAHAVADRLEKRLNETLAPAQSVIHIDPYDAKKDRQSPMYEGPTRSL